MDLKLRQDEEKFQIRPKKIEILSFCFFSEKVRELDLSWLRKFFALAGVQNRSGAQTKSCPSPAPPSSSGPHDIITPPHFVPCRSVRLA